MRVATIGLDTSKHLFQVHGVDATGRTVLRRRLRRNQLVAYFANLPCCVIGLEASGGAHYWARTLSRLGHTVRLMAPQFVKPYVKSNKNDANDAEAICEAVSRPTMRFVPTKCVAQQDWQMLHRVRSRLIGTRTQLSNQIRGLLAEYGIVIPRSVNRLRAQLPSLLEDPSNELTPMSRSLFATLYEELVQLEDRIRELEGRVQVIHRRDPLCQRIAAVEGIGPVTATAIVAAIHDGRTFRNGRQLSAWLGLVPRQYSSAGKPRLLGISKRGDPYLRTLLIHGARSVVWRAKGKQDARSRWIVDKQRRLGTAKACVALANKNARVIWALLAKGEPYQRAA